VKPPAAIVARATIDQRDAEIMLGTAAFGYAAAVSVAAAEPESKHDEYSGAVEFLRTTALAYAGALGNLSAGERAEIDALRRFRDGVLALRGEIANGKTAMGEAMDRELAVETIDALLAVSYPPIGVTR
jgi:hypothetical protein